MSFWKYFGDAHRFVYERSGGRLGARMAGRHMLLLTTTGRRSGEPRTLPLAYLPDGAEWVVVASNGGSDRHPAWFLNLEANPRAQVRVGREAFDVTGSVASGPDRARLWPLLKEYNPPYAHYETKTERELPVVVLRRF